MIISNVSVELSNGFTNSIGLDQFRKIFLLWSFAWILYHILQSLIKSKLVVFPNRKDSFGV